jgi:hypothetical protein
MKTTNVVISMAVLCMALTSAPATAQRRGDAVMSVRAEAVAGRRIDLGYRRAGRRVDGPAAGPAFCRNGRGHPVHGWRWCVEKGWVAGGHVRTARLRWDRVRWGHVRLYAPRGSGRIEWLPASAILDVRVVQRLHRQAARLGLRGSLVARVSRDRWGGVSVEIRSGRLVFAEILDRNRDGRADLILVARA